MHEVAHTIKSKIRGPPRKFLQNMLEKQYLSLLKWRSADIFSFQEHYSFIKLEKNDYQKYPPVW